MGGKGGKSERVRAPIGGCFIVFFFWGTGRAGRAGRAETVPAPIGRL